MRELEARLAELEGRHSDTLRSYEALQHEYTSVKQELERLRKGRAESSSSTGSRDYSSHPRDWDESKVEILDPLLFDVSAFCFDQEDSHDAK
jgi:AP-1-like factor